jgi:general transcription factor 3C polypeptide 3 (transcription factor C subunit 4)
MASLASGLKVTDSFITSTLQKHLFREMKLSDTAVKNPDILKWIPLNKRYAPTGQAKSTDPDEGDDDVEDNDRVSLENESTAHDKFKRPEILPKALYCLISVSSYLPCKGLTYQSTSIASACTPQSLGSPFLRTLLIFNFLRNLIIGTSKVDGQNIIIFLMA